MSNPETNAPVFDATIRFDKLPKNGRNLKLQTTPEQRKIAAEILKIDSLDQFTANLHAKPIKGGIQVTGSLDATVTQPCVVSFVPVTQQIKDDINRLFIAGTDDTATEKAGSEVFVDLEGEDLPDYFEGPEVDLSHLLLEIVALGINPHPRAPDAVVPKTEKQDEIDSRSPFAALKQLKSTRD